MPGTAVIIGQPETCRRLERQLALLAERERPIVTGWVVLDEAERRSCASGEPVVGIVAELETVIARRRPQVALVSLRATMGHLIQSIRTRLRKHGVPDRFCPMLEDQLSGIGPRSLWTVNMGELLGRPARKIDEDAVRGLIGGKRVLITGAGGSIGSELSRIVAKYGPSALTMIDRSENSLFEIDRQIARFFPGLSRQTVLHDVVDEAGTHGWFHRLRPEIVFHAAAHKHVPMMEDHPAQAVENNVFGTKFVADAGDACGASRLVLISTDKAVRPTSIMGATKRLAEMYVQHQQRQSAMACCMVRFGNVLGSSGSVIDVWSRQVAEGGPLTITDPRMTRYFMTIPEAASLVIQAAALVDERGDEAEVFVLNMGEPIHILDMARRFVELSGLTPVWDHAAPDHFATVPGPGSGSIRIVQTGIRPGEKLHEELARDVEALQPTRHPDIDIWALPQPEAQDIVEMFRVLSPLKRGHAPAEVAAAVRRLVPEMCASLAA